MSSFPVCTSMQLKHQHVFRESVNAPTTGMTYYCVFCLMELQAFSSGKAIIRRNPIVEITDEGITRIKEEF